ncbi:MAG TPA: metalloregulator ArsR/SmtB family transcription factor [Patescibacteria group bacterium]
MSTQNKQAEKGTAENDKFVVTKKFLKTVSDTNRLRILCVIGNDTLNVTEIYRKLKLPQNLTSHHISKLKAIGLLNEKREGTFRLYSVNNKKMKEYGKSMRDLLGI